MLLSLTETPHKESSAPPRNDGSRQRADPAHYCSQFTSFKYSPDIIPVKLVKTVKMTLGGPGQDSGAGTEKLVVFRSQSQRVYTW